MAFEKFKDSISLTKGIFIAYFILGFHLLLIAGLGLLVLFFRGMINYMIWMFIAGTAAIVVSAYLFYKHLKTEGKTLGDLLKSNTFRDQSVEISLLGGLASLKLGHPGRTPELESRVVSPPLQLEDAEALRDKELLALARLLEKELITPEEYGRAKQTLIKG